MKHNGAKILRELKRLREEFGQQRRSLLLEIANSAMPGDPDSIDIAMRKYAVFIVANLHTRSMASRAIGAKRQSMKSLITKAEGDGHAFMVSGNITTRVENGTYLFTPDDICILHNYTQRAGVEYMHALAMDLYQNAVAEKERGGDGSLVADLLLDALTLEEEAASRLGATKESEPVRSILYHGAASIAYHAGDVTTALRLIKSGLSGSPNTEMKCKLSELAELCKG